MELIQTCLTVANCSDLFCLNCGEENTKLHSKADPIRSSTMLKPTVMAFDKPHTHSHLGAISSYFFAVLAPAIVSMAISPSVLLNIVFANLICLLITILVGMHLRTRSFQDPLIGIFIACISSMALICYESSVTSGSAAFPYIPGGDGEGYFHDALFIGQDFEGNLPKVSTNYSGYQVILAILFSVFGESLIVGMCFNYTVLVVSALLISAFASEATKDTRVGKYTLIACCISSHFIAQGTILQKDVMLIFAFSLFAFSVLKISTTGVRNSIHLATLLLSIVIVGITRLPFTVFLLVFLLFSVLFQSQTGTRGRVWQSLITVFAVGTTLAMLPMLTRFTTYEFSRESITGMALDDSRISNLIAETSKTGVVGRISGLYAGKGIEIRLLLAPLPVLVQYLLPFAFTSSLFLEDHPWYFINNQLGIVWLFVLGPTAVFALLNILRLPNLWIRTSLATGVIAYASVAFSYMGVIPRYATPSFAFVFPAVGYIWARRFTEKDLGLRYTSWMQRYWIGGILMATLYFCLRGSL